MNTKIFSEITIKETIDALNEETLDYAESKLLQSIRDGNVTSIIFYLKTKGKKRGYVEQVDNNVSINPFEQLMKRVCDDD